MSYLETVNSTHHENKMIHDYVFTGSYNFFYGVQISGRGGVQIKGVLLSPVGLNFSVNYSNNAASNINRLGKDYAGDLAAAKGGKVIANEIERSRIGRTSIDATKTIQKFEGQVPIGLTIEMLAMKEFQPDYTKIIEDSLKMSTPDEVEKDMLVHGPTRWAPDQELNKNSVTADNTFRVMVGNWLEITHLLCTSFNYQPSPQVRSEDGEPLYLRLTYNFITARAIGYPEIRPWFKQI